MSVAARTKAWARSEPHPGNMPAWKREVLERKRAKKQGVQPEPPNSSPNTRGPDTSPHLVLRDSLGPLNQNPFIRLEKERRRDRVSPPGLLELNVPGIRTIRADNIIIIESDPDYFQGAQGPLNDPLEELMSRRGGKVAEIRANEVVIYQPSPSSQEPRPSSQEPSSTQEHRDILEEAGRVSRLLEKFDRGSSRPPRSRSWDNILDRGFVPSKNLDRNKAPALPNPVIAHKNSQVPVKKAPKRSGELSPLSTSFLDEESRRFPLNDPSWLPSKPPPVLSLPEVGQLYKRPSSPTTPLGTSPTLLSSPVGPLSPSYETSTDDKTVLPVVASFRERFEAGTMSNNLPLSKFVGNPKATSQKRVKHSKTVEEHSKEIPVLTNGHMDHLDGHSRPVSVQDLLTKTKQNRSASTDSVIEQWGQVPSSASVSTNDNLKNENSRRPNSEADLFKPKSPTKSSATKSDMTLPFHFKPVFNSATPNQLNMVSSSTSSNNSFEIRPAQKPDLSNIPEDDVKAKALANIRMQSKNSFVFIPKKMHAASESDQGTQVQKNLVEKPNFTSSLSNGPKLDYIHFPQENGISSYGLPISQKLYGGKGNDAEKIEEEDNSVSPQASVVHSLQDFDWKSGLLPSHASTECHSFTDKGAELEYLSSVHQDDVVDFENKPDIPITNIDDIVNSEERIGSNEPQAAMEDTGSDLPSYHPHASLSSVCNRAGNTFTIVPKRKPLTEQEAFRTRMAIEEEEEDESGSKRKLANGIETPYSEIGAALKKRYPTADEIKVVGGYLSLSKSCLSKNGSTRKKLKITFDERNIQRIFEYPSESSLVDEEGDEGSGTESEEDERPLDRLFPRVKFASATILDNSVRANATNSGLSNYTPKSSVRFKAWTEDEPSDVNQVSQHRKSLPEDLVSPDDSSKLALYF
ncbi:hypothetical protein GDO86_014728 [Hymenochirus boettgeri]|uniref:Taperin n=1 Tax=Hymenochirus boettgeri TaxID=247094 RepID=A0A8T2JTY6_9PIPI|nr:hypothetical protein GDO86_014728 [Hymenochirus boettgeri]